MKFNVGISSLFLLAALILGCAENVRCAANQAPTLKVGDTVFVRVKTYQTLSGEPTITEMSGATGYNIKDLNPEGLVAAKSTPTENDASFSFGEQLTLIQKKSGVPTLWQVAKGKVKVWLPEFLLTPSKAEIDFLKKNKTIPATMTYIYDDNDTLKVWGAIIMIQGCEVVESHGLSLMAYDKGTSPVGIKGNAVMFDKSALKHKWGSTSLPALVYNAKKQGFKLAAANLYYCIADGKNAAFESINFVKK